MKNIIAVASGKGGVGKSTVAANLAVALANRPGPGGPPLNVALVDVDFYGPSIPTLMGASGPLGVDHEEKIIPALRYGVKYISIAFFLQKPDDPVIWRGPMFGKAISQLFEDVSWGDVDICLVDMPPGTGDAQLSLAQLVSLSGALLVTTPQEVAVSDVRRAVNMFRKVEVDVLGVVENMSGFITPNGETIDIFGSGGAEKLSRDYDIPLLGKIPLDIDVRKGGDEGRPSALDVESQSGKVFHAIGDKLLDLVKERSRKKSKLKVVN